MMYNDSVVKRTVKISLLTAFLSVLLLSSVALAELGGNFDLPENISYTNTCALCHYSDFPELTDLTSFGLDYLNNGKIWNRALAEQDSDNDDCTNGFEIGDVDGNGIIDDGSFGDFSNPALAGDCSPTGIVDEATWGSLKALFSDSRRRTR